MLIYSDYKIHVSNDDELIPLCIREIINEQYELDNDWDDYADDNDNYKSRSVLRREMIMEDRYGI